MLPPELIAKLNECASTNFVVLRDASLFWQTVFSRIVIAGLLFEGPELIHEMLSLIGNWFPYVGKKFPRFDRVVSSKRFVEYAKLAAFCGWILIIVGLGGELRTSSRIVDFSARIEECSDAKVTKATLEAGEAAVSAKIAHEEADGADIKARQAETAAGAALSTSKAATEAAVEAQDMVDTLTEQSDQLDRKIWQTRYWMSGRTLVDMNSFIGTLRKFKGKEIVFASFVGEPEPWLLCNAFVNAAFNAEMKPIDRCAKDTPSAPVQTDIVIFGPDQQEINEFVNIVAHALTAGGAGAMPVRPGSTLTVLVGSMSPFIMDKTQVFSPPPIRKQTKRQHKKP